MSSIQFQKATKKQAKLRLALEGPAGFGKTYTALTLATELGGRIAYVDTEAGSASKYAHLFDFDVIELAPPFHPDRAVEAIEAAVAGGYATVVIDSLSHFWQGEGGLLQIVNEIGRTKYRGDSHRAWADGGEIEQRLINAILRSPLHVIGAMRTKKDYIRTEVEGKTKIRAAGTKTIQREEFDFEFDLVCRFDVPTVLTVMKSRCDTLPPETIVDKPGAEFAAKLKGWLDSGEANDKIERPDAKDKKQLARAIETLSVLDGSRDWAATAEAYAQREFHHPLDALAKPDFLATVGAMAAFAETLTEKINADAAALAESEKVGAAA